MIMVKILILDDYKLFRQGLVIVLKSSIHQVIEAVNGAALLILQAVNAPILLLRTCVYLLKLVGRSLRS